MKRRVVSSYILSTLLVWILILILSIFKLRQGIFNILSILTFASQYFILSTLIKNKIHKNGKLNERLVFITSLRNLSIIISAFLFIKSPDIVMHILGFQELLYFLVVGYIFKMNTLFYTLVISLLVILFISIYLIEFFYFGIVALLLIKTIIFLRN